MIRLQKCVIGPYLVVLWADEIIKIRPPLAAFLLSIHQVRRIPSVSFRVERQKAGLTIAG